MTRMKFIVKVTDTNRLMVAFNALSSDRPIGIQLPLYGQAETMEDALDFLRCILNWEYPGIDFRGITFKRTVNQKAPCVPGACARYIEWVSC